MSEGNDTVTGFVTNDARTHPRLVEILKKWYDGQFVKSYVKGTHDNQTTKSRLDRLYVKSDQGCILFSYTSNFGSCYIIPQDSVLLILEEGKIIFGDEMGYFVLKAIE